MFRSYYNLFWWESFSVLFIYFIFVPSPLFARPCGWYRKHTNTGYWILDTGWITSNAIMYSVSRVLSCAVPLASMPLPTAVAVAAVSNDGILVTVVLSIGIPLWDVYCTPNAIGSLYLECAYIGRYLIKYISNRESRRKIMLQNQINYSSKSSSSLLASSSSSSSLLLVHRHRWCLIVVCLE